jgi:hypothetical protein
VRPVHPPKDVVSALMTLWVTVLGLAIMLGVADRYVSMTYRCLVWPLALMVRTGTRWFGMLIGAVARWMVDWIRYRIRKCW